jgi:hypothetical protein
MQTVKYIITSIFFQKGGIPEPPFPHMHITIHFSLFKNLEIADNNARQVDQTKPKTIYLAIETPPT